MVIVMLVMTGLWALMDSSTCNQWAALNPDHNIQWKFPAGCLYETPDGLWVGSENIIYANGDLTLIEGK
jgi:hypothetical protein